MKISYQIYRGLTLLLYMSSACLGSFIMSFQSGNKDKMSTDQWAEYTERIPPMQQFTSCFWEKLRYFATDYTNVWGYCKEKSKNDKSVKCTQFYHRGTKSTRNRHINIYGWIDGKTEVTVKIKNYLHRNWNHFCWSYSCITGHNKFYYNGEFVGMVPLKERPIIGSDDRLPDAFIIGQEQDTVKGRYELSQIFNGELSELNLWNQTLSDETILSLAKCKSFRKGNIVGWEKKKFKINKAITTKISDPTIFCKRDTKFALFPQVATLKNARTICAAYG